MLYSVLRFEVLHERLPGDKGMDEGPTTLTLAL